MKLLNQARARIAAGDIAASTLIDLAVGRALQGDATGALAELQNAYDNGWRDYGMALLDPMLTALRDDPGFRALLDRAAQDVAAQRERAKTRGLLDLSSLRGSTPPLRQATDARDTLECANAWITQAGRARTTLLRTGQRSGDVRPAKL